MSKKNRVNFFGKYNSTIERLSDLRLYMVFITVVVLSAMLIINLYNIKLITAKNNEISATANQIASKERVDNIKRYRDLIDGTALLNDYYYEIEKIDQEIKKGEIIDDTFFNNINEAIPYGVKFESIDASYDEISINGSADEITEIAVFQNNLEQIKQVESVHVQSIDKEEGHATFALTCKLKEVN